MLYSNYEMKLHKGSSLTTTPFLAVFQSCPHLIDVLYAVYRELCEAWDVELAAAIWTHLDLQLVVQVLPQQAPELENISDIS